MGDAICRGWIKCSPDGEIKGGCGKCTRCAEATKVYLKKFAEHAAELRKAANRLGRLADELPDECKSAEFEERLNDLAKAIRGGRKIHDETPGGEG